MRYSSLYDGFPLNRNRQYAETMNMHKTVLDNITVGSHIAVVYGRRWYIGRVEREVGDMYDVSYMAPSKGKWKWGRTEQGLVDKEDVLMHVATPRAVGSRLLLDITMRETQLGQAKFNQV